MAQADVIGEPAVSKRPPETAELLVTETIAPAAENLPRPLNPGPAQQTLAASALGASESPDPAAADSSSNGEQAPPAELSMEEQRIGLRMWPG
jgi:hypothetical protein